MATKRQMIVQQRAAERAARDQRIIKLYTIDKKSIRQIMPLVGVSYGTVHRVLSRAAGVEMRSRGGRVGTNNKK